MAFGLQMTHQWPVTQATWEFPPFLWWAFQGCNSGFSPVRLVLPRSSQQGAVDHIQKGVRASFWRVRVLSTCVDGSLSEAFSRPSGDFTSYLPYDTVIPWWGGGEANEVHLNVYVSDFISEPCLWSSKPFCQVVLTATVHSHSSLLCISHLSNSWWPKEPQSSHF